MYERQSKNKQTNKQTKEERKREVTQALVKL